MVISSSLITCQYDGMLKNWGKEFLAKEINFKFRKAGRFAIAAICGALKCLEDFNQCEDLNIYLGSSNGDTQNIKDSQDSVFLYNEFPFPFSFINTLNNTPLFFLIQHLNIKGSGISIASNKFAFEQVLALALADLSLKKTKYALLGVCDVWFEPKDLSEKFLQKNDSEFSAWLLINNNKKSFVRFYTSFEELLYKIKNVKLDSVFYISPDISNSEKNTLLEYIKITISQAPSVITNTTASIVSNHFLHDKNSSCSYIGFDKRFGYSFLHISCN